MHYHQSYILCLPLAFICAVLFFFFPTQANAALIQNDFRFYTNTNSQTPTDPWPSGATDLGENTAATGTNGVVSGDIFRIRLSVNADATESAHTFKLQYKVGATCSGGGTWIDVGGLGSGEVWRGYDNATPTDDSTLSSSLLAVSDRLETYEETNNSAVMPNGLLSTEDGEWDWVVQDNGAPEGNFVCFRMVKSDGTVLGGYNDYPQVETKAFTPKSQNWRWYDDETNETPSTALAAENTQPFGQPVEDPIKLRLSIAETGGLAGTDQRFRLQFSTSPTFASGVEDVVEIGSCSDSSKWCYANGVDADDAAVTTRVLSDSSTSGRHNETGVTASTFDPPASATVEYEFTIKSEDGSIAGTVYYFRAYDVNRTTPVVLFSSMTYPQLKTRSPMLSFSVEGLPSGSLVDGYTTNISTTSNSVPFGLLVPNQLKIGAHRITVSQDGEGYQVFIVANGGFVNALADDIDSIPWSNASPSTWTFNPNFSGVTGSFGYHPDDDSLSSGSTRFLPSDTWAALSTTSQEIFYTNGPVLNDVHDIIYQAVISALQPAGTYTIAIQYIILPVY